MMLHRDYYVICPHCGAHRHNIELSVLHDNLLCCWVCCKLFGYTVGDLIEEQTSDHRQQMEALCEYEQKRALRQLKWIMITCLVIAIIVAWLIIE